MPPKFVQHPAQSLLGGERLVMCRETVFDSGFLEGFKRDAVATLLLGVVMGKERAFLFAVGAFDMIDPFCCDTKALVEVFSLLF